MYKAEATYILVHNLLTSLSSAEVWNRKLETILEAASCLIKKDDDSLLNIAYYILTHTKTTEQSYVRVVTLYIKKVKGVDSWEHCFNGLLQSDVS